MPIYPVQGPHYPDECDREFYISEYAKQHIKNAHVHCTETFPLPMYAAWTTGHNTCYRHDSTLSSHGRHKKDQLKLQWRVNLRTMQSAGVS